MRNMGSFRLLLLVGVLSVSILSLNTFVMLPSVVVSNQPQQPLLQSAFATFPGENGKLAFNRFIDNNWEIYVMNSDGSNPQRLTNNTALDSDPSWSPDGTKIAFISDRAGGSSNPDIYVMNSDGSNPQRLTNDRNEYSPSWSPDGTKIAFHSHRDGNAEIYVINAADGSNPQRLTNNASADAFPSWSPDGSKIAFSSERDSGRWQIYVMNSDGSNPQRLTNNQARDFFANWSPDGSKIAFNTDRDGNLQIYVMDAADGNGETNVSDNPHQDISPSWSPDGTKIAFHSSRDGQNGIYVMDEDGRRQTMLTDNSGSNPDWGTAIETNPPAPPDSSREAIERLISYIENLEEVPESAKVGIVTVLERVLALLSDNNTRNDASACNILGAFVNQVDARERRGSLTEDQADDLRTQAEDIRDMSDCG